MQYAQNLATVAEASIQKTILLVEDHPIFSKIMTWAIAENTPHRVIHLFEGSRILQVINEHKPHLLVLDYDLPGLNGIELYDLVHSTEGLGHIPAIMVSAGLPEREIEQRNLPGLHKPCSTSDLLRYIEEALV